jgi:hypothetical protein
MNKNKLLLLFFILIFISQGCKKYDDGPTISLRSKKARVVGKWVTDKWIIDKTDFTSFLNIDRRVEFTDDGIYHYQEYSASDQLVTDLQGSWAFRQEKEQLLLGLPSGSDSTMVYELWDIMRLKNKKLWLEYVDYGFPNSTIYEWKLKAE